MSNVQASDFKYQMFKPQTAKSNIINKKSVWWTANSWTVKRSFLYSLATTSTTLVLLEPFSSFKFVVHQSTSYTSQIIQSKIVKCPISRVNHNQISNIQTCHVVKHPISLISFTVGPQNQEFAIPLNSLLKLFFTD